MKINVINVINAIEVENATMENAMPILTEKEDRDNEYAYYKWQVQSSNDYTWELIEWLDKYGRDYSHLKIEKIMSYKEWLEERLKVMAKYLVA